MSAVIKSSDVMLAVDSHKKAEDLNYWRADRARQIRLFHNFGRLVL